MVSAEGQQPLSYSTDVLWVLGWASQSNIALCLWPVYATLFLGLLQSLLQKFHPGFSHSPFYTDTPMESSPKPKAATTIFQSRRFCSLGNLLMSLTWCVPFYYHVMDLFSELLFSPTIISWYHKRLPAPRRPVLGKTLQLLIYHLLDFLHFYSTYFHFGLATWQWRYYIIAIKLQGIDIVNYKLVLADSSYGHLFFFQVSFKLHSWFTMKMCFEWSLSGKRSDMSCDCRSKENDIAKHCDQRWIWKWFKLVISILISKPSSGHIPE